MVWLRLLLMINGAALGVFLGGGVWLTVIGFLVCFLGILVVI